MIGYSRDFKGILYIRRLFQKEKKKKLRRNLLNDPYNVPQEGWVTSGSTVILSACDSLEQDVG